MPLRLRIPELLNDRGITAYELAQRSEGRISRANAYRLVELHGDVSTFSGPVLEALMDVLEVNLIELFERKGEPVSKRARAPAAKQRRNGKR